MKGNNKSNRWFFESINKIGKPLDKFKKRKQQVQVNAKENEKVEITADTQNPEVIISKNYIPIILTNFEEMDKLLDTYKTNSRRCKYC